jgi:nucleolar protein 9
MNSYETLSKHRFASHVIQTLLNVTTDTVSREVHQIYCSLTTTHFPQARGILPAVDETADKGELRTATQLVLDIAEVLHTLQSF